MFGVPHGWRALFRGGLPVAVPVVLHPDATARVFFKLSELDCHHPPGWLIAGTLLWLIPAFLAVPTTMLTITIGRS